MKKLLFSPGPVPQKITLDIDFSHRSDSFKSLYQDTVRKLREVHKIPPRYEVVFVQGSGTAAIEAVISSLSLLYPEFHGEGVFCKRTQEIASHYLYREYGLRDSESASFTCYKYLFYVQFETSRSEYIKLPLFTPTRYRLIVVDSVSAFGFYPLPDANVIIACSGKILGGLPTMGIVLYDENALSCFRGRGEYLNIPTIIAKAGDYQTPHTPLLPQLMSLNMALDNPITPEQIRANCKRLSSDLFEFEGSKECPVVTIRNPTYSQVKERLEKEGIEVYHNPSYMQDQFQVSMFNYRNPDYYRFLKDVLEEVVKCQKK